LDGGGVEVCFDLMAIDCDNMVAFHEPCTFGLTARPRPTHAKPSVAMKQKLGLPEPPAGAPLTPWSQTAQFKHGLTSGHGDVLAQSIVDSESKVVEDRDRRSVQRTDYGTDQSRSRERSEQLAEDLARSLGVQF